MAGDLTTYNSAVDERPVIKCSRTDSSTLPPWFMVARTRAPVTVDRQTKYNFTAHEQSRSLYTYAYEKEVYVCMRACVHDFRTRMVLVSILPMVSLLRYRVLHRCQVFRCLRQAFRSGTTAVCSCVCTHACIYNQVLPDIYI